MSANRSIKTPTSFYLSPEIKELIGLISKKRGLYKSSVVQMAVTILAEREGIQLPPRKEKLQEDATPKLCKVNS